MAKRTKRRSQKVKAELAARHVRLDHTAGGETDAWDEALARAEAGGDQAERIEQSADAGRVTLDDQATGDQTTGDTGDQTTGDQATDLAAERVRLADVIQICDRLSISAEDRDRFIREGVTGDAILRERWNQDADQHTEQDRQTRGRFGRVEQADQQTDLGRVGRGMSDAMIQLCGSECVQLVQRYEREQLGDASHRIDGGEFRGMRASEMLRVHFSAAGVQVPATATDEHLGRMMCERMRAVSRVDLSGDVASWDRIQLDSQFRPWTIGGENGRIGLAAGGGLPGAQGRDQFPNVLRDAMHRVMLAWFNGDAGDDIIWRDFCSIQSASDFRTQHYNFIGSLPNLEEAGESGAFNTVQLGDSEEGSLAVKRRGQKVRIGYETIVNDDLGRIMQTTMHMGGAANRTVEDRLFDQVLNTNSFNGTFTPHGGTSRNLFNDSTHRSNRKSGAPTSDTLYEMWANVKTQAAIGGNGYAGVSPDTILCNTASLGLFETILRHDLAKGGSGGPKNLGVNSKFSKLLDSPRVNTDTRYYVQNSMRRPIAASFLRGVDSPILQQMQGWEMEGTVFCCALVFEVAAISDYGIAMSTGM